VSLPTNAQMPSVGEPGLLICPVCGKPVEKGSWFFLVSWAIETVQTGTPIDGRSGVLVPQRPVHLTCVSPFPLRAPNG
jgi:hypothetical protein